MTPPHGGVSTLQSLERDGTKLAYVEQGAGEPPVVLVHGWCCEHTYMAPLAAHFAPRHRIVAVDLRGHGASDRPERPYTMEGFADDLAFLCDELAVHKPIVIGHSMGGLIALDLAARYPELPRAVVALDSPVVPPQGFADSMMRQLERLKGPDYLDAVRRQVANMFLPTDDAERKKRIIDGMSSTAQHVMASAMEQMLTYDSDAAMAACRVPFLHIGSAVPMPDWPRLKLLCPQAVNGQVVGSGHFLQLEVPEQVHAMIDRFLAMALAPAPLP